MVRFPSAFHDFNINIGDLVISGVHVLILSIGIALMLSLQVLVFKTNIGKALRAVAENRVVAGMYGLNVNFIVGVTFAISSGLAGVAGVLTALAYHSITPFMGVEMGLKGLTVIVLGGMGSLTGAMIGGLMLGLGEVLAMGYLPMYLIGYKDAIAFIILIMVLLIKPSGLMGRSQEVKV
jgi:branched-chain amino acid transport system permease protein